MDSLLEGITTASKSPAALPLTAVAVITASIAWLFSRPAFPTNAPHFIDGYPLLGCLDFFWKRREFLNIGKTKSPNGQISFYYGPHPIVALSGAEARSSFYMARGLDLNEGFNGLLGQGPDSSDFTRGEDLVTYIARTFRVLMTRDRLNASIPKLTSDVHEALEAVRSPTQTVVIQPFTILSSLVYRLTHRIVGSNDIADDPKRLEASRVAYHGFEFGSAVEIMFPSLPTPSKIRRTRASARLQEILVDEVRDRRKTGRRGDDAMQVLIDRDDPEVAISSFIIGGLLAGVINAGVTAAWTLSHLATDAEWHERVLEEVDVAVEKFRKTKEENASEILTRLSLEDWESGFAHLDLCLRETIRLHVSGSAMRKNTGGKEVPIGKTGNVIPKNAFAVYNLDDVHFDGNIYADPQKWDPSRYHPDRAEDKKVEHAFLGWGSGLHPCLGTRFAKLEMIIAIVMLLAYYNIGVDGEGRDGQALPEVKSKAPTRKLQINLNLTCTPRF